MAHERRHERRIVTCQGPGDPHCFDGISRLPRRGELDKLCPVCAGHGEWNVEYDLVSQRAKRCFCHKCDGRGWIETGDDPVPSPDIVMSDKGYPMWTTRYDESDDRGEG